MTHASRIPADRPAVAHVITQLELGGAQRNTLHTISHLDPQRFLASLISGPGGALDPEARSNGLTVTFCPALQRAVDPATDARALAQVTAALRAHRRHTRAPLVVHTHSSKAGMLGRVAARAAGAAVVVHTVHGFGFHPGQPLATRAAYMALERAVAPLTDALVFVSRRDLATAMDLGLVRRGNAHVIRSGIDLSAFQPDRAARVRIRAELAIPEDAPVLVTVGNFKDQKNPLGGLEAFARVAAAQPRAHWITTGDGPLRDAFAQRAQALGLAGAIHLPGWRRDIADILNAGDVFLLPSTHEGLPRAVLEALSVGLPVAATDAGGTHEVVVPGAGRLVPVGKMDALAQAALDLLRSPPDVRAAASPVLEEFNINTMVRLQEELYTALLSRSPSASR